MLRKPQPHHHHLAALAAAVAANALTDALTDLGHLGRTTGIATHALVFMVRGLSRDFKIPLGFFFVQNTCPSQVLAPLLVDCVIVVDSTGLNVVASVSDQGPTNRGAISILRKSCEEGEYECVYDVNGKKIVHIFDVPHILKNIRNNLLVSFLKYGQKGRNRNGQYM